MSNDDIVEALEMSAKLMELHGENPFKTKAYTNAAFKLSKLRYDFQAKTKEDIEAIEGIGKGISAKIVDLMTQGTTAELTDLLEKTPAGVIEILGVKGLGPKKVRQLWLELNIESIGELLYACNENRLITLKGFGEKTQAQVKQNIEFKLSNQNKFHYASLEKPCLELVKIIQETYPKVKVALVGQLARKLEIIDNIEILLSESSDIESNLPETDLPLKPIYFFSEDSEFNLRRVELSSTNEHLQQINLKSLSKKGFESEQSVYEALGMQYIEPELREGIGEVEMDKKNKIPKLI